MRAFWKKGKRAFALGVALFSVLFGCAAAFAIAMDVGYAATSGSLTGVSDQDIGLSFNGGADNPWTVSNGTNITGKVTSTAGTCGNKDYESTLKITNNKNVDATLSFSYAIDAQGGTIKVDGTQVNAGGNFSKQINSGKSVEISIQSKSTTSPTKIEITNLSLVIQRDATVEFLPSVNGTYTVDGQSITQNTTITKSSLEPFSLKAIANNGYEFLGWEQTFADGSKSYISFASETNQLIEKDGSLEAIFSLIGTAQYQAGANIFDNFESAVSYATGHNLSLVSLFKNGDLPAGNHEIPSTITFLVPFDDGNTVYIDTPKPATDYIKGFVPFRQWRLSAECSLSIKGKLSVGGTCLASSGSQSAQMTGPYGLIVLASNSSISVENGGELCVWGFAKGEGQISVRSGGTVREWFQILDFRGGSATIKIHNKVFPFNQYAVQNIESNLKIEAGAFEKVYGAVYASDKVHPTEVAFIGGEKEGMFRLKSGFLEKQFNRETGRILYSINGDASLSSLSLSLGIIKIDSADYVFPITNNMSISLKSGTLSIEQNIAILSGVKCSIAKGAELIVAKGYNVYLYDDEEWLANNYSARSKYVPVKNVSEKENWKSPFDITKEGDAEIDINGTLTANGYLYCTVTGASIVSSEGGGKYLRSGGVGTETKTYQYTQSGSSVTSHDIAITPAKLKNADGTFTETSNKDDGPNFVYSAFQGKWLSQDALVSVIYHLAGKEYSFETLSSDPVTIKKTSELSTGSEYAHAWSDDPNFESDTFYLPGENATFSKTTNLYPVFEGWVNGHYYFDKTVGLIKGFYFINVPDSDPVEYNTLYFDENGRFDKDFEGVRPAFCENANLGYLYVKNGRQTIPSGGWYRDANIASAAISYYYFGQDGYAYSNRQAYIPNNCVVGGATYLCAGWYTFENDGHVKRAEDVVNKNAYYLKKVNGIDYCLFDGAYSGIGLFECDGYVYYAQKDASIFKNGTLYVADMHGITDGHKNPLTPGLYYFDDQGRMFDSSFALIDKTSSNA